MDCDGVIANMASNSDPIRDKVMEALATLSSEAAELAGIASDHGGSDGEEPRRRNFQNIARIDAREMDPLSFLRDYVMANRPVR